MPTIMTIKPGTLVERIARLTRRVAVPLQVWHSQTQRLIWKEVGWPVAGLALALVGIVIAAVSARPRTGVIWLWVDIGLVLAAIVLLLLILSRLATHLIVPLSHLRDWAQNLRTGNFSARVPESSSGEFAELVRDINRLGDWLHALTLAMDAQVRQQTLRLARKTQSLDILYDVASSLNRPGGLDKQLESFLDTFVALVDAMAATVRLHSDHDNSRLTASRGLEAPLADEALLDTRCPHCGWESLSGRLHFQHGPGLVCAKVAGPQQLNSQYRELVVVPIRYQDNLLGVYGLLLDRPVSSLGEDVLDLLIAIGRHLGLAVEKARLDHDARRLAIIEERQLIGNELHDSLAQALVSMRLQIKMLGESLYRKDLRTAQNEVRTLKSAADEAHTSLRELLSNFRLKMDDRGLVPAVKDMVERFRQETDVAVFFHNECPDLDLSPVQEIQVFHIIQEALTNIRKHSHARNVRILLNRNPQGQYTVLIEDDGNGMIAPSDGLPGEHIGISIMRERAERLPGELSIESDPGEGTRVVLTFPHTRAESTRATGG
jgi:two-component system nitrate/nitrite sensor histidine kinase NarX